MFDRFELQFIDGSKYLSADPQLRRSMVPQGAGIYIWTSQLGRSFDAGDLPADTLLTDLQANLAAVRRLGQDTSRVGRYRRVKIFDDPVELTAASADRLQPLLTARRDELSWVLLCASVFQRPLYVGKTVNFRDRMRAHFTYKTTFSKLLRKHGVELSSCVVTLCPLSLDGSADDSDVEDEDEDEFADYQDQTLEVAETDAGLEDEEVVPLSDHHTDAMVRLAESMVIRTSHPLFNEKMD